MIRSRWVPTRPRVRRIGAVSAVAAVFVATIGALTAIAPVNGTIRRVAFFPGSLPLRVADAVLPIAVAFVSLLRVRLYVTPIPAALLGSALAVAFVRPRARFLALAGLLAVGGGATVTVLTGCHCGTGSATLLGWKAFTVLR